MIELAHWSQARPEEWRRRWPSFTPQEMRCHGTGRLLIDEAFMDRLQRLRDACGFALPVTSGYRAPEHNARVSPRTGLTGPHTTGHAADIRVYGARAYLMLPKACELGFTGIGGHQRGDHKDRYVHVDDLEDAPHQPRPTIWSY